ncbi:MAG: hypothetical protein F7B17_03305 [Desulfurococcales archaeon]|nr:hypothetical protein [Desulfurococcales archaeon]
MANLLWEAVSLYERWASGEDLGEDEVYRLSSLLGSPTRKLDVALSRYRDVVGRLIEERCSSAPGGGEVCIYTWARWAFKRYFSAALDAGGTVLWKRGDGSVVLLAYPLHRAFDVGVRGVSLPGEPASLAAPRLDGWQVNAYWDPMLGRWEMATRFVLHNMRFTGRKLTVAVYGERINPVVEAAWAVAERLGLEGRLGGFKGWTLSFMLMHREPATALRRLPSKGDVEDLRLVLLAARKPDGTLLDPLESVEVARSLGVESLGSMLLKGLEEPGKALEASRSLVSHPAVFLWYRDDREHPSIYEVKSQVYEDYVKATRAGDARSLLVLLTSGVGEVEERLREALGGLVDEVKSALGELEDAIKSVGDPEALRQLLEAAGIQPKLASSAAKALREKPERALRIVAVASVEGFKVEEAAEVLRGVSKAIKESAG